MTSVYGEVAITEYSDFNLLVEPSLHTVRENLPAPWLVVVCASHRL